MRRALPLAAILLAVLVGCGTYHPAPLDEAYLHDQSAPRPIDAALADSVAAAHPLLPPLVFDPADGLSPDEAAVYAVLANPDLRAARTARGVARASLFAAGLLPDPQLAASADIPVHKDTGALIQTGLGLSLDLNAFFAHGARADAARAAAAQVDLDVAWQEWQVAQQARLLVCRAAYLDRQVAFAAATATALDSSRQAVDAAAGQGFADGFEQAAATAAAHDAHATLLDRQGERAACRRDLNRLLGLAPGADIPLQMDDVPFARAGIDPAACAATDSAAARAVRALATDSLRLGLERSRLDLRALRRGYASQEASVRAAVKERFPRINLGVNRLRNDAGLLTLGPAITLDLPFLNGGRGDVATARATRAQLRQEYAARVFAARAEAADLLDDLARTRRLLADAAAARDAARRFAAACDAAWRAGDLDLVTRDAARSERLARELDVLQLRRRLAELAVGLETVSGRIFTVNAWEGEP